MTRIVAITLLSILLVAAAMPSHASLSEPVKPSIIVEVLSTHTQHPSIRIIIGLNVTVDEIFTLHPLTEPRLEVECAGSLKPTNIFLSINETRLKQGLNILVNMTLEPPCNSRAKLTVYTGILQVTGVYGVFNVSMTRTFIYNPPGTRYSPSLNIKGNSSVQFTPSHEKPRGRTVLLVPVGGSNATGVINGTLMNKWDGEATVAIVLIASVIALILFIAWRVQRIIFG